MSGALPLIRLDTMLQWIDWFEVVQNYADTHGFWDCIDPTKPDQPDTDSFAPHPLPTFEEAQLEAQKRVAALSQFATCSTPSAGPDQRMTPTRTPPAPGPAGDMKTSSSSPSLMEILAVESTMIQRAQHQDSVMLSSRTANKELRTWIVRTVNTSVYRCVLATLKRAQLSSDSPSARAPTTRQILRGLESAIGPGLTVSEMLASQEYIDALEEATRPGINADKWLARWTQAHARAVALQITAVTHRLAPGDFLDAVGQRLAPEWASYEKEKIRELMALRRNAEIPSFDTLVQRFMGTVLLDPPAAFTAKKRRHN